MKKIDEKYDNPIDNFNIYIADKIAPCFRSIGLTANDITTMSLVLGLLSIFFLWKGYVWLFAITFYISYFFDDMDGYYARKYKITSKIGDLYDHGKDFVVISILLVVLFIRNKNCSSRMIIPAIVILAIVGILASMHYGCIEKMSEKQSDSLGFTTKICPNDPYKSSEWLRFFGAGTWIVVAIVVIVWLEKKKICT